MVDYLLSHSLVEITVCGSWDTTCGTCKSVCVAFISGEYLWISYQCKEKKPCYLSLFNSSFSTFELWNLQKKVPKYGICGRLHKNVACFQTKTCTNIKFMTFICEVHDSNVIVTACLSWHFYVVFLSHPRQISMTNSFLVLIHLLYQWVLCNVSGDKLTIKSTHRTWYLSILSLTGGGGVKL
jgi:hypothetical protein